MEKNRIKVLDYELEIVFAKEKFSKAKVFRSGDKIYVYRGEHSSSSYKDLILIWLKQEAKKIIEDRTYNLAKAYGFDYKRISIKDQVSRWGSCSSKKNLNFNWRLILAPSVVLDYVIIHELAHTVEMNHSKNFWDIVAKIMPDYKNKRLWLKSNGGYLMKII